MSEVIENRVVQMAFDNTKFEKGVRATLNLLDRLNSAIAGLNGIKYNVLGLADAVKSVTFDPINQQMQIGVSKAIALTAALTGVYNISNQIYNTITSTFRSMTFDQISNGYSRYEQMVNSTQVILNATKKAGETEEQAMERVEAMQERLLWFADETSYDAMAMLDTAGKFLNRGFDINLVSTAMEGIANWAATAGVNAQGATVAMQQLAQAMGSPYIRQQDWISIAGLNMDTKQFKELVIQSALAHKTLKKVGDEVQTLDGKMKVTANDMEKSFSKGWFTNEVLMDVLEQYGKANDLIRKIQEENTGFTVTDAIKKLREQGVSEEYELSLQAFEMGQVARTFSDAIGSIQTAAATKFAGLFKIFIGDYLDAKELWTGVSEELYDLFIEPLNVLLDGVDRWSKKFNGTRRFWDATKETWKSIKELLTEVHALIFSAFGLEAQGELKLYDVLVSKVSYTLFKLVIAYEKITTGIRKFNSRLAENEIVWDNIKNFFKGIKIFIDLLIDGFTKFKNRLLFPLFDRIEKSAGKFSALGTDFLEFAEDVKKAADKSDLFNTIFDTTYEILDKVLTKVEELFDVFQQTFEKLREKSIKSENGEGFFTSLVKDADETKDALDELVEFIAWALDTIGIAMNAFTPIAGAFAEVLKAVAMSLGDVFLSLLPLITAVGDVIVQALQTISQALNGSEESQAVLRRLITTFNYGVANILDRIHNGNLDAFERFLNIIQENVLFYKRELFGGNDIFGIFKYLVDNLLTLNGLKFAGMLMLFHVIKDVVTFIQDFYEIKWNGFLGTVLFGDTLENLTSQWFYKALAQTISAIADVILAMAATLLLISMVPENKIDHAVKILDHMVVVIMLCMTIFEIVGEISARITTSKFNINGGSKKEGILGSIISTVFGTTADSFMESAKYTGLAMLIGAFSNAFIKMAVALILISTIDKNKLNSSMGVIALCGLIITAMITAITVIVGKIEAFQKKSTLDFFLKTGKEIEKSKLVLTFISVGILLSFMARAVLIMAKAVKTVSDAMQDLESEEDIWIAVGVIFTLMSLMAAFFAEIAALGRMTTKTTTFGKGGKEIIDSAVNFLSIARMIGVLALAISVMIAAVMLLGHMEEKGQDVLLLLRDLGMILGALVLLIGVIIGAGYAAKHIEPGSFEKLALAIAALTPPLLALAVLVGVMSFIDEHKIVTIASSLSLLFGGLATMIGISSISQPAQIMAFAGAMSLVMLSLLTFVPILAALIKFGDQTDAAISAMVELGVILAIFAGVIAIVGAIVGSTEYGPALMAAAGFIDMIAGAFVLMGLAFALVGSTITNAVHEINVLIMLIEDLEHIDGDKVADNLKKMAKGIPDFLHAIGQGLALGMEELNRDGILYNFIASLFGAIIGGISLYKDSFINVAKEFLKGWFQAMIEVTPESNEFWRIILTNFMEILMDVLDIFVPRFAMMITETWYLLLRLGESYAPSLEAFLRRTGKMIINLANWLIIDLLNGVFELFTGLHAMLNEHLPKIIKLCIETVSNLFIGLNDGIAENAPGLADSFVKMVISVINAIADAIDENKDDLVLALWRLVFTIGSFIANTALGWTNPGGLFFFVGENIVVGLIRGIRSRLPSVKDVATSMGETATDAVAQSLLISSPSKVMEKLGNYTVDGFVKGLNDNKDKLKNNAIETLTGWKDEVVGIIKENIGWKDGTTLQSMLFSFFDIDPSIMPTLDLSGIESGIDDINSMLTNNVDLTSFQASLGDITNTMNAKQLSGLVGADGFNIGDISLGNDSVTLTNAVSDFGVKMDEYMNIMKYNMFDKQDVNVYLEGDTKSIFNVVRKENVARTRATGYNALAMAQHN